MSKRRKSHTKYLITARKNHRSCYYCGRKLLRHEMTADHVVPLCAGGYDKRKNVVPCCRSCNGAKGAMSAAEFMKTARFVDPDSLLNQLRRKHPNEYDLERAHAPIYRQ